MPALVSEHLVKCMQTVTICYTIEVWAFWTWCVYSTRRWGLVAHTQGIFRGYVLYKGFRRYFDYIVTGKENIQRQTSIHLLKYCQQGRHIEFMMPMTTNRIFRLAPLAVGRFNALQTREWDGYKEERPGMFPTPSLPFSSHTPRRSGCSSALPYPPGVQGEIDRLLRLFKGNIGALSEWEECEICRWT